MGHTIILEGYLIRSFGDVDDILEVIKHYNEEIEKIKAKLK